MQPLKKNTHSMWRNKGKNDARLIRKNASQKTVKRKKI